MRIVLDTNVLVSALLSRHAAPADVLRLTLEGAFVPLYDQRILAEYREVLARPAFNFDPRDTAALLRGLEWSGELVFTSPLNPDLPDPDDLPFLEVAVWGEAEALVTGNVRHFRAARGRINVLTPRELLDAIKPR